ncbi:NADH dehydrogenase [ubiquinone] 1 alpha subcomplex subunit 2 [Ostrinia nubilalis]|uniref:NADH dehydrogenase [ubiquinone] 1 alpha subcomplex subunit 2 n=1 Tax=Ostrinia furnacalis TaxID=93504 RepID=UPI00103A85F0|nr:NADH dehydrogenase [ubiquinone] 1 alpha subcomplex subunit 2 [Ostrinia furnacalis]
MAVRLGGVLKELRIHLCQTSAQSAGVREFIQKNYVNLKKDNPTFPILIRECSGVQPRVWARYEKGVERSAPLTNLTASDVMSTIKQLAK